MFRRPRSSLKSKKSPGYWTEKKKDKYFSKHRTTYLGDQKKNWRGKWVRDRRK